MSLSHTQNNESHLNSDGSGQVLKQELVWSIPYNFYS